MPQYNLYLEEKKTPENLTDGFKRFVWRKPSFDLHLIGVVEGVGEYRRPDFKARSFMRERTLQPHICNYRKWAFNSGEHLQKSVRLHHNPLLIFFICNQWISVISSLKKRIWNYMCMIWDFFIDLLNTYPYLIKQILTTSSANQRVFPRGIIDSCTLFAE